MYNFWAERVGQTMTENLRSKIFENKEFEITTEHRIFGKSKAYGIIENLIDDQDVFGIVMHKKKIYCYKDDEKYNLEVKNDRIIVSDSLMTIIIRAVN